MTTAVQMLGWDKAARARAGVFVLLLDGGLKLVLSCFVSCSLFFFQGAIAFLTIRMMFISGQNNLRMGIDGGRNQEHTKRTESFRKRVIVRHVSWLGEV